VDAELLPTLSYVACLHKYYVVVLTQNMKTYKVKSLGLKFTVVCQHSALTELFDLVCLRQLTTDWFACKISFTLRIVHKFDLCKKN